jgi:hypothetical protein
MPLSDLLEGGGGLGIGLGLVAGAAIILGRQGRPLVKGAIVGYLSAQDRVREFAAETVEQMQDLYEEARAEYEDGRSTEDGILEVVEDEPPPPPAPRPRAGRGRRAAE